MGKFSLADENLANFMICKRCKSRNIMTAEKCRKCGYRYLRPKRKEKRVKK
ncbi:MAG: 50S ribosomal protein L40e [Candidatus Micrarchaeaceae archaeon]